MTTPGRVPTHAEIATSAQALWRELERPQGRDDQIWFAVERTIVALQRRNRAAGRHWVRAAVRRPDSGQLSGTTTGRLRAAYAQIAPNRSATSL